VLEVLAGLSVTHVGAQAFLLRAQIFISHGREAGQVLTRIIGVWRHVRGG